MPLMSAVSLSAAAAFRKLRRGVAFAGGSAVRSPDAAGGRRLPRCHQAARAGTGGRARAAAQGGRTAAKAEGRYRGDRTGPHQAQPATDRHRRPGAQRRDPDRRGRGAAAPARRPRAADHALRSIHAAPKSSRCWRRCSAPAGARRRRCWCGPKTRCNRCAPRCCSDRSCPNCADARRNSPPISANS